jgi:hypothetical protein
MEMHQNIIRPSAISKLGSKHFRNPTATQSTCLMTQALMMETRTLVLTQLLRGWSPENILVHNESLKSYKICKLFRIL